MNSWLLQVVVLMLLLVVLAVAVVDVNYLITK